MGIFERISLTTSMLGSWLARGLHSPIWWMVIELSRLTLGKSRKKPTSFLRDDGGNGTRNLMKSGHFRWGLECIWGTFFIGFHLLPKIQYLSIPGWFIDKITPRFSSGISPLGASELQGMGLSWKQTYLELTPWETGYDVFLCCCRCESTDVNGQGEGYERLWFIDDWYFLDVLILSGFQSQSISSIIVILIKLAIFGNR